MICPICKRARSKTSKRPFDGRTLDQHLADVHGQRPKFELEDGDLDFDLTTLIADDDMPDGAFWALADEMGEW